LFPRFLAATLVGLAAPAFAQSMPMNMPGMTMPAPAKKAPKKTVKKAAPKKNAVPKPTLATNAAEPKAAVEPAPDYPKMQRDSTLKPADMPPPKSMPVPMDHMQMDGNADHPMAMTGALGSYPEQRESSGTAWQPDSSGHTGLMVMNGDWMLMAHGVLNLVFDHQSGPRGDEKAFASGMLMGMVRRPLGDGTLQFKAMLSPEPLMGPKGYPLLLASGETANGNDRLIDRQHPHDLFMELSGSVSQNIGSKSSAFVYGGLPGEPAFGPPAFMHRESILDSPEAPITHHWLDSTHITFGVVTAGLVVDRFKIEASRFNGREPDQHRWNIETGALDSTSVRLSWNPTRTLALQTSWARLKDPETLEPGIDQTRWSASVLWADDVAPDWHAASTLAWGRKSSDGHKDDGVATEASMAHAGWTVFGRGEWVENRELLGLDESPAYRVGKVSLGAVRGFRIADHLALGVGGLLAINFVPDALDPFYGSSNPIGAMGFVRLKLN